MTRRRFTCRVSHFRVFSACPHVPERWLLRGLLTLMRAVLFLCVRSTAGAGLSLNELNGSPRLSVARTGEGPTRSWVPTYLRGCAAIVKMGSKLGWTLVFFGFHGCNTRRFFFVSVAFPHFCLHILYSSTLNILPLRFANLRAPLSSTEFAFCSVSTWSPNGPVSAYCQSSRCRQYFYISLRRWV